MNRRQILIIAVLILVPTLILFLVSYFVQPVLPPPWNNALILLGIVVGAVLTGLAAFKDILELVDRLTGRSPSQPSIDPPSVTTNVQQTGRDSFGTVQAQQAIVTQTFNFPSAPLPPGSPAPPPLQRPARATHFTGREAELAQLLDDLQPGRVVTLTGPGGIGKSALAAEAGRQQGKKKRGKGEEFDSDLLDLRINEFPFKLPLVYDRGNLLIGSYPRGLSSYGYDGVAHKRQG